MGVPMREIPSDPTCTQLLFPIDAETLPQSDPELTGRMIKVEIRSRRDSSDKANGSGRTVGQRPYRFRIELSKSRMEASKRACISGSFQMRWNGHQKVCGSIRLRIIEAGVRLLERKDGGFTPYLKLYTIKDKRFSCRKEFASSSIAPVNRGAGAAELTTEVFKGERPDSGSVLRRRDDAD
ncbi:MAG: hypothetical protein ACLTSZ_10870 [Lachnospiraceae bacterium]